MSFQVGIGSLGGTLFHSANHVIFILVYCYRRAQILREEGRKSTPLTLGEWKILLGVDFFYQVAGVWGGVHLTIQAFFKVKKTPFCKY